MSTRWYPIYQKGNPQLRVFLPNFWMKLVRPENKQPPNVVLFKVSMEMTEHDVENYLREIYKVPVVGVRCRIQMGEFFMDPNKRYVKKRNDDKFAYVHMPEEVKFEYPSIFLEKEKEEDKHQQAIDEMNKNHKDYVDRNKNRPGLPGWFSI